MRSATDAGPPSWDNQEKEADMKARTPINAAPEAGMAVAESMAGRARSSHRNIPVIMKDGII